MAINMMFAAAGVLGVTYLSSPFVALYRLGHDLQANDCASLAGDVDWPSVRAALKAEAVAPKPAASDELPPFGASFVTQVADSEIDRVVTPEAFVSAARAQAPAAPAAHGAMPLDWGFFDGPRSFTAWLHTGAATEIGVRLRLEGMSWRVVEVILPDHTHRT